MVWFVSGVAILQIDTYVNDDQKIDVSILIECYNTGESNKSKFDTVGLGYILKSHKYKSVSCI